MSAASLDASQQHSWQHVRARREAQPAPQAAAALLRGGDRALYRHGSTGLVLPVDIVSDFGLVRVQLSEGGTADRYGYIVSGPLGPEFFAEPHALRDANGRPTHLQCVDGAACGATAACLSHAPTTTQGDV